MSKTLFINAAFPDGSRGVLSVENGKIAGIGAN